MPVNRYRIATYNVRGLCTHAKKQEIITFINDNDIDIMLLQETMLKCHHKVFVPGYSSVRLDRENQNGGGLIILIRHGIPYTPIDTKIYTAFEHITIKIGHGNNAQLLTNIYIPKYTRSLKSSLRRLMNQANHSIAGDWNSIHGLWSSGAPNQAGRILQQLIPTNGYTIYHPHTHTHEHHNGAISTIDFIVSNAIHHPRSVKTNNELFSDHIAVTFTIKFEFDANTEKKSFVYQLADWIMYRNMIKDDLHNAPAPIGDNVDVMAIENCIEYLTNSIINAHDAAAPVTNKKNAHFTISATTKKLIQSKNTLNRRYLRATNAADKQLYKSVLARARQLISKQVQIDRNKDWTDLIDKCNDSSTRYWRLLKQLRRKHQPIKLRINNLNILDSTTITNEFGKKFHETHTAFQTRNTRHDIIIENEADLIRQLPDENQNQPDPFTIDDLKMAIQKLRCKKSPGADGINNRMIRQLPEAATEYLLRIFNKLLQIRRIPPSFKSAVVIPIQKAGKDPNALDGYRPVSLLNAFSKLYERLLLARINAFNDTNNVIPDQQYGFRTSHSATHQATKLSAHLTRNKRNRITSGLVTLDVANAFNSVWHSGLIVKLNRLGLPLYLTQIISDYCTDRSFIVRISDKFSDVIDIPNGLPQGAVLSPKLCTMYVADLPASNTTTTYMFADDTAILATAIQKRAISTKIEKAYNTIDRFYDKWHISVNPAKTNFVLFPPDRKGKRLRGRNPSLAGNIIEPISATKYLGVLFDSKLSFTPHADKQKAKIITISRQLYPLLHGVHMNNHRRSLILKQIIWPVLSYGMPAWASLAPSKIKSLRQKFSAMARSIMRLPRMHPTDDLYTILNMEIPDDKILHSRRQLIDTLYTKNDNNLTALAQYLEETWPN